MKTSSEKVAKKLTRICEECYHCNLKSSTFKNQIYGVTSDHVANTMNTYYNDEIAPGQTYASVMENSASLDFVARKKVMNAICKKHHLYHDKLFNTSQMKRAQGITEENQQQP